VPGAGRVDAIGRPGNVRPGGAGLLERPVQGHDLGGGEVARKFMHGREVWLLSPMNSSVVWAVVVIMSIQF
jgi:hypothetical protein